MIEFPVFSANNVDIDLDLHYLPMFRFIGRWPKWVNVTIYNKTPTSRKHVYIILTPLNPTFILYNWGLQGYTLFFLFLLKI